MPSALLVQRRELFLYCLLFCAAKRPPFVPNIVLFFFIPTNDVFAVTAAGASDIYKS